MNTKINKQTKQN